MNRGIFSQISQLLTNKKNHRRWVSVLLVMALAVSLSTTVSLMMPSKAYTDPEKLLVCPCCSHEHTDECYDENGQLCCEYAVAHTHDDSCFDSSGTLICTLPEVEAHVHDESCYTTRTTLVCGLEESEGHHHTDACYTRTRGALVCTDKDPEHVHDDDCYEWSEQLTCELSEGEGAHVHTDACYQTEKVLTCTKPVLPVHQHTESCFRFSEDPLVQEDAEEQLQSDPTADVETAADWTAAIGSLELTGDWARDLLLVAESQLGYAESERNFALFGEEKKGYTRYGAWYGAPYEDWCAIFIDFCLHFAQIDEDAMPRECSCDRWIELLKKAELYTDYETFDDAQGRPVPLPGDLIFLRMDETISGSDHVAIVRDVDPDTAVLTTIEGNSDNCVQSLRYPLDDDRILGFASLPEAPDPTMPPQEFHAQTDTMEVSVSAPAGAFPEGTTMTVEPVAEEEIRSAVEEAVSDRITSVDAVDITFFNPDGEEIEPARAIRVNLRSDAITKTDDLVVVHLDGEGESSVVPQADDTAADGDEIAFDADRFSVYALVTTHPELDGQTYGIINTTGSNTGTAMMSSTKDSGLLGETLVIRTEPVKRTGVVFVDEGKNITMWTFHHINDDYYYITVSIEDTVWYLQLTEDSVRLVTYQDADDHCILKIQPGTGANDGKYKISNNNRVLRMNNGQFISAPGGNNSSYWMNIAELSNLNDDDFVVYTATKVSVSDTVNVPDGAQVIVYTRIWNADTRRYDYFAIDYDGMLVRCYESGDTISWVGSKINTMLWDFTEYHYAGTNNPNYYYELQNVYSGKYLAPQVSAAAGGTSSFLFDHTVGINLNGRKNGAYYSTILAWDDPYYDYASLHAVDDHLISVPMSMADDFYFAIMAPVQTAEGLTRVATIDHKPFGITLKMQDYENITSYNRSQDQVTVLGNTTYNQWTGSPGLLEKNLYADDYPSVKNSTHSLSELYNNTLEVNQQFLLSTYQETGYFEYDSTQNFAHLITSESDPWYGQQNMTGGTYRVGDFVIYDQLGTTSEGNKDTLKHGQFLPYNDLTEGVFSSQYVNEMDIHAKPLSSLDPRKGEKLYEIKCQKGKTAPNYVDHFFGMEMSAKFMQSESGLDAWGHDLIFEFSGDDDFWLYVDGMLVLDLGGIHSALDGNINFRTGKVVVNGRNTNLRTLYKEAYLENHSGASEDEVNEWLNTYFDDDGSNTGTVFKDYSGHSMRMFYMERGAGASNLHMRFNLAPYTEGEVLLEKEVSGTDNIKYTDTKFPFQIYHRQPTDPDNRYSLWDLPSAVTDTETNLPVEYASSTVIGGKTYEHVFYLRPGQTVSVKLPNEDTDYFFQECGLDSNVFDAVYLNRDEDPMQPTEDTAESAYKDYRIVNSSVTNRKKVIFNNHVNVDALKRLIVTKKVWRDQNKLYERENDTTPFRFRIYIGQSDGSYSVYGFGKYYVLDPEGCYCIYVNGSFVSTGKTELSELSTEVPPGEFKSELDHATFYTSQGGAADKIPQNYSVVIPELMDGTPFKVEERDYEIPAGYQLIDYDLLNAQGSTHDNFGTIHVTDEDDPHLKINNWRGFGLTVNKVWSDAAFMESHDDIYFAVYLKDGETLTLLPDSVRRMHAPNTTCTWFYDELAEGKTLNDYLVYEVRLTGEFTVDGNTDQVTGYSSITRVEENGSLTVGGSTNEHAYSADYVYTANYSREVLNEDQISNNINSRTDTVTNSRPGLKLIKTDLDGHVLAGGVFSLEPVNPGASGESDPESAEEQKKIFVSDADGLIAVAYLPSNSEYILTEIASPEGHQALISSLRIKVIQNGSYVIYVNDANTAPENGYYLIEQVDHPTVTNMPSVTIKNRPFTLEAVKVDATTNQPMAGIHFALYSEQLDYYNNVPIPDYHPIEGFEDLITGSDGVIPDIDVEHLKMGSYYLRETQTPEGYYPVGGDIHFTITEQGQVVIHEDCTVEAAAVTSAEEGGVMKFTLTVKNTPKQAVQILKKSMTPDAVLPGASFALYKSTQLDENGLPKSSEEPIVSGTSDEQGLLYLGALDSDIDYFLFETHAPDGYNLLASPVKITVIGKSISAYCDGPLPIETVTSEDGRTSIWQITVRNSSGYELPHAGGSGSDLIWLFGLLLTAAGACGLILMLRRKKAGSGGC